MKITFLVKGLGEYAQAEPIARLLEKKGITIQILTENNTLIKIANNDKHQTILFNSKDKLIQSIDTLKDDGLFLCNSHTTYGYNLKRPKHVKKIFSLDSNWLFNNEKYNIEGYRKFLTYNWIDTIFIVFPKDLFESNLIENGGFYEISESFKCKVVNPGFVPQGDKVNKKTKEALKDKYRMKNDEVLLVMYFSRPEFHSSSLKDLIYTFQTNVLDATHSIVSKNDRNIKVLNLSSDCPEINSNTKYDNILLNNSYEKIMSTKQYNNIIGSADIVVMHYGYGTLPKIFHNEIPVLCFIPSGKDKIHSSYYEQVPLIKKDVIDYLFFEEVTSNKVENKLCNLLLDPDHVKKMQSNQRKLFSSGEEYVVQHVINSLK